MNWIEYDKVLKAVRNSDPGQFPESEDRLLQRLHAAMKAACATPGILAFADFINLLANVIRTRIAEPNAPDFEGLTIGNLEIPDAILRECHFEILQRSANAIEVRISKWNPDWLPEHVDGSLIAPTLRREERRPEETCTADPFLVSLGRKKGYLSPALREAMRSVITAPAGGTLVVNFPTGSGKSLLAQVPALLRPDGLSVVVVPTTALCIDQERALRANYAGLHRVEHQTAFFGDAEVRRNGILNRIRVGTQRIVFASPEAVCGCLMPALWGTATAGRLDWLVIDEAHIVEHWGDSFRPAFQQLAGVRRGLLRAAGDKPFRTLLMSATLTAETIDTLELQFGAPGPFKCINSVRIRPEIASGFVRCDSSDSRVSRTIDAILNLPKPLIAYTTTREAAARLHRELRDRNLQRIALFTGCTADRERELILCKFRAGEIDIVIATSAFGMGIDAEVRSVVHSCVPESFDRYYQEIGRGGRDGAACISLLIYSDEDLATANSMANNPDIGMERGLRRWKRMHERMQRVDGEQDLYKVLVNRDVYRNQRNYQWDNHTLNLLASARIIEFDAISTPQPGANNEPREDHHDQRIIRVVHHNPTDEATWEEVVGPIRLARRGSSLAGLALMNEYLGGKKCLAAIAHGAYSSKPPGQFRVMATCGGCAVCHSPGSPVLERVCRLPVPNQPWKFDIPLSLPLQDVFRAGPPPVKAVFFRHAEWQDHLRGLRDVAAWAIRVGVRFVVAEGRVLETLELPSDSGAVMTSLEWPQCGNIPAVPALRVLPRNFQFTDQFMEGIRRTTTPQLLLVDEATNDEVGRTVLDLWPFQAVRVNEFREVHGIGIF